MEVSYQRPPDVSLVPQLLGVSIPFLVIALSLYSLRISIRWRKRKLGVDDAFLTAAVVCAIGYFIAQGVAIHNGTGRHFHYLTYKNLSNILKMTLFITDFYVWCVTFVKVSLACMLLRIINTKTWRIGLYTLIAIVFCLGLSACLVDYLQCRPLRALWDLSFPPGHCWTRMKFRKFMYLMSSLFFVTDIIFCLLPVLIVLSLSLRRREKVVLCVLMGLGIIATSAIIPKYVTLYKIGKSDDISWDFSDTILWSFLEMCLGIIAASIPGLKTCIEQFLRKIGVISTHTNSEEGSQELSQGTTIEKATISTRSYTGSHVSGHEISHHTTHDDRNQEDMDVWEVLGSKGGNMHSSSAKDTTAI